MMAYKCTKSIVRSDDGDIYLEYVLRMSLDLDNNLGLILLERQIKRYRYVDYAEDFDILFQVKQNS